MHSELIDPCFVCSARGACVFCRLAEPIRRRLHAIARPESFARGKTIVRQGDLADGLWVVQSGVVRLYHVTAAGKMEIVKLRGPGSLIGATAALTGGEHLLSADTVERSRLELLPRGELVAFLEEEPRAAIALLDWLAQEQHQSDREWCEALAKPPLAGRLWSNLLDVGATCGHSTSEGIALSPHLTVQDLAFGLGCSRQWTSKLLGELEDEGRIVRHGRRIILTSADPSLADEG